MTSDAVFSCSDGTLEFGGGTADACSHRRLATSPGTNRPVNGLRRRPSCAEASRRAPADRTPPLPSRCARDGDWTTAESSCTALRFR